MKDLTNKKKTLPGITKVPVPKSRKLATLGKAYKPNLGLLLGLSRALDAPCKVNASGGFFTVLV